MNAARDTLLNIEVVYADPDTQILLGLNVPEGTNVGDALRASGIAERCPGVDFKSAELGVWGQRVNRSQVLRDGDRIEVYRPLAMDPREARRQRAQLGLAMGQKEPGDTEPS